MKDTGVVHIGIDVSKDTLDIDAGDLGVMKVKNTPAEARKALRAVARKAGAGRPPHVCFESTGAYTAALAAGCRALGLPHSVLNPHKVSCFARSLAHAKTDRADAAAIRRYAEVRRPAPTPSPRKASAELDKLLLARDHLVKSAAAHRNALETLAGSPAAGLMRRAIAHSEKLVARYDRLIAEAVAADAELAGLTAALGAVKGVGALTAAKVAAWMPEIGTLGRRRAAALAGLAPHTRESGKWKGLARTGGGRKAVRDALFMPSAVAVRHDPHLRQVHAALMARGKPYKVALTAVMRKLIGHLDAVARDYYAKRNGSPR